MKKGGGGIRLFFKYSISPVKVRSSVTSLVRWKSVLYLGFSSTSCNWATSKSFRIVRFEVLAMTDIKIQFLGFDFL